MTSSTSLERLRKGVGLRKSVSPIRNADGLCLAWIETGKGKHQERGTDHDHKIPGRMTLVARAGVLSLETHGVRSPDLNAVSPKESLHIIQSSIHGAG